MNIFRREWGAITFVLTVVIGAIAVAISLVVTGSHQPPVPTLPPCPSYTPYVLTPTPSPAASASPTPKTSPSPSASATASASLTPAPTPTPFNPALANCPTPPARPLLTPGSSTSPGASTTPIPTAVPTPTPQPTPPPFGTPLPS